MTTETLYPIFYGTRLATMAEVEATFKPHCHPETWRRAKNFLLHQGGKFGIGGGYRPPGTQPDKPGFAPPGKSFHEGQQFSSGLYYSAFDTVVVNPGYVHRSPRWEEVPQQGSDLAFQYGMHHNVGKPGVIGSEAWHQQPVEIDGYDSWVASGRPDLQYNYPILLSAPRPQPPQPPVPTTQPVTKGIIVQFTSRELVQGSVGNDVKFYQRRLNDLAGQGLLLDGHFGGKTKTAVLNWQSFFKLPLTGKLDGVTQKSIIEMSLHTS